MLSIQEHSAGISFKVRVQPRSSRDQIIGLHGDALKLKLTAAPVEGAANEACVALLSKALEVPRSRLKITSGQSNRSKTIFVRCDPAAASRIRQRLQDLAAI